MTSPDALDRAAVAAVAEQLRAVLASLADSDVQVEPDQLGYLRGALDVLVSLAEGRVSMSNL